MIDFSNDGNNPIAAGEFDDSEVSYEACVDVWAAKVLQAVNMAIQHGDGRTPVGTMHSVSYVKGRDCRGLCELLGINHDRLVDEMDRRIALAESGRKKEAVDFNTQKRKHRKLEA